MTGGNASLPNLLPRIQKDFRTVLPVEAPLNVIRARDPALGAWKGARKFAQLPHFIKDLSISRAEYEEYGADYLKAHFLGN